ncbi:hypothetical protein PRZ48_013257 [Zasmidium cellare]|uniref:Uncharacterized protein n=1 Tax=Zasmidium cellare TaxID=395010 RepID=A0ABR0E3T1_ZASCE|nr:hypothetical protein PRZ48_013257 [Zasmidium cellare]
MPSTIQLLITTFSLLSATTAQDIIGNAINGNGISCIGDNACCSGTLRSNGNDIGGAVCCTQDQSGNLIEGQGTTCATGTGVPLTAGVTITADSAAATGDSSSSAGGAVVSSSATTSTGESSPSPSASSGGASSSAAAATTSSGSGAVKTMAAMGPAALGMGAMAVVFGGIGTVLSHEAEALQHLAFNDTESSSSRPRPTSKNMANLVGFPTTNRAEHQDGPLNEGNPLFVKYATDQTFRKYETDVETATVDDMITIEYICSYVLDRDGVMWLVSEEGKGVAKMSRLYVETLVGELGDISPLDLTYEHDGQAFQVLLGAVRAQPELRQESRSWAQQFGR